MGDSRCPHTPSMSDPRTALRNLISTFGTIRKTAQHYTLPGNHGLLPTKSAAAKNDFGLSAADGGHDLQYTRLRSAGTDPGQLEAAILGESVVTVRRGGV